MAPSAAIKATKASSSKKGGVEKKAPGRKRNTVAAASITPPSPPITPVKRNTRTSATPTKAREASTTFNEEDATSGEEVEDAGEQVISTRAEELARLTVEGEVVAIYDSIWTMEDTDTVKVFTDYQGETVVIKEISSRLRSDTSKTYKAIYSAGPYEAVYSCETGEGSKIFHNFALDFVNNAMVEDLCSDPLTFKFVDQLDRIWNDRAHCWIDTNPYLYLEVHVDRAKGHYFGSWAKRREYDDEEMDENNRTRLTPNDLDRLWMRKEVNMQHPAWSRLDMNAPRLVRPWCGE
ncbi:hypothetical protein ACEPPN_011172 [Leptodophora sp. 'Broadleaf-Isolate-01']